jgi:hypothetical protein
MENECASDGDGDMCSGHGRCFAGECQCVQGYYGILCNSISERDVIVPGGKKKEEREELMIDGVATSGVASNGTEASAGLGRSLLALVEDGEQRLKKPTRASPPTSEQSEQKKPSPSSIRFVSASAKLKAIATSTMKLTARTGQKCPNSCSGHGDCDTSKGQCLCASGFTGLDCSKTSQVVLEESTGVEESTDGKTGISKQESTGTGCAATCKAERGTCESLNGHVQCVCRPDSMWSSGNSDGSPNLEKCDKEECPGRCGMDDASGIAKGACNERGECTCDIGFAGASCEIECPNRCSSHGRCDRNMAANTEASYHCFCESPWTGKACDQTSHSNVVVSSMVVIAIGTFIVGLCCIPLMREYWTQRETERYRDIIKGERDLRDQLEAMGISENGSVGSMNT